MDGCVGDTIALDTSDAGLIRSDIVVSDILVSLCLFIIVVVNNGGLVDTVVPCWVVSVASVEDEGILFCFIVGLGICCGRLVVAIHVSGDSSMDTVVP